MSYVPKELIEYSAQEPNVNLTISLFEKDSRPDEVKGIQFDLYYDSRAISLSELTSLIDGSTFEYTVVKEGGLRCVIFDLDGKSFNNRDLSRLISMSFLQKNNFYSYTDVKIDSLIVVGDFGEDISYNYIPTSFRIDFNGLKPTTSYLYEPENIFFQDSTLIFFQLHEPSNVEISVYDIFDFKQEILLDMYMDFGIHYVYMDSYNQNQEEFLDGRYKIKLILESTPKDSIYVVYEKNKN